MQEKNKTLIFVLVALMAVLVAWEPWRPAPAANNAPSDVGTKLFPAFTDPNAAKSLSIITYDEDNGTIGDFQVAEVNGVWSIPSHNNYPADAREHMAQAATALLDLEILGQAPPIPDAKELYGVIAPEIDKLKPGDTGVGRRITLKGDGDKVLADVVIGKEVKDHPGQHFVRRADRDQIYKVNVKTDKFSTKFEDWIEKNLLKLNAFDVRTVDLNDYTLSKNVTRDGGLALRMTRNSLVKLAFDDAKSTWNLTGMDTFEDGKPVPVELAADEELNSEKLNTLKNALNDLVIVDVQRKPKGLSQDLRASDEFVKDNEARMSLIERGFYPVGPQNEIFSSEGDVTCATKDGVKYVLRFGNLAGTSTAKDENKPGDKGKSSTTPNRYLFVMAQLDENQIAKPEIEPVPGEEAAVEKPSDEKAEEKPAEEKPAAEKAGDEKAPETKTAGADDAPKGKGPAPGKGAAPKAKAPATAKPAAPAKAAASKADTKPAATEKNEPEKDEAADAEKKDDAEKKEEAPAELTEEQKVTIQKENKRKQDEYDAALKKANEKVAELNGRFADWYFIISDDVYKKIHLGRADIVKKKDAEGDKPKAGGLPGIHPGALPPGLQGN